MRDSLIEISDLKVKCTEALKIYDDPRIINIFEALDKSVENVARSWSKSWLGYQSHVYYVGFTSPQPYDCFSIERGFKGSFSNSVSENWREYNSDQVFKIILSKANIKQEDFDNFEKSFIPAKKAFQDSKDDFITLVEILYNGNNDKYLEKILNEATNIKLFTNYDFIAGVRPTQQLTRDMEAASQGLQPPPHISLQGYFISLKAIKLGLEELINCLKKAEKYLLKSNPTNSSEQPKKYIFIGHGRSNIWKDLKDFLHDRLLLDWEEFNRESAAGISTSERLRDMADNSKFAFIIMTAEDEHSDGNLHARENVIHEVGLFQGKIGFRKTIILLEDGCTEFSNISGLGQIRFPKGRIDSKYEELRKVLERENII
jgi:predicted nucleotide-binding protein